MDSGQHGGCLRTGRNRTEPSEHGSAYLERVGVRLANGLEALLERLARGVHRVRVTELVNLAGRGHFGVFASVHVNMCLCGDLSSYLLVRMFGPVQQEPWGDAG